MPRSFATASGVVALESGFEGGQMPLYRRLPKRGFTCRNSKEIVAINVSMLNVFENDAVVDIDAFTQSDNRKNHQCIQNFVSYFFGFPRINENSKQLNHLCDGKNYSLTADT